MAQKIDFSTSTFYKAKKFGYKLTPYKFHKSQLPTVDLKKQRAKFCKSLLNSEIDFQNMIFTDETIFTEKLSLNRQDTSFWSCKIFMF